jgi:hypothetical protein
LTSVLTLARVIEISATSELEKNADSSTQAIKKAILRGSMIMGSPPRCGKDKGGYS